jgi:YesN/AraC family two-component response regulator
MMVNILLVDDDISSVTALTNLLEHAHTLRIASNGLDAIQTFQIAHFDVVITDIRMPKMDGIDLLKAIRKFNKSAAVIILTGYPSQDNIRDAEIYGVSAFFTKPLDVERFMDTRSTIQTCHSKT